MTTTNVRNGIRHTTDGVKVFSKRSWLTWGDIVAVVVFTILYGVRVAHDAVTRAFWVDELFTYYIVTMPDWGGMFDLIRRGPDLNPPLFYTLTRLVVSVFGESEWVFRLPAMVGYWLFCLSLYILGRCIGGNLTTSLIAMATPFVTGVVYYAGEARPYGLMLGCFGVGLVCYALVADADQPSDRRRSALLGLGGSLSLGTALHYMTLLPIACLWLVEAYRTWRTGQRRWAVWAGLCAPLAVLAYNWSFLYDQSQVPHWKDTCQWSELPDFYWWLIGPPAALTLLILIIVAFWFDQRQFRNIPHTEQPSTSFTTPTADSTRMEWLFLAFVFTFALPIGWMILMQLTGKKIFLPRYLLPAVVGLSIFLVYAVRQLTPSVAQKLSIGVWLLLSVATLWVGLQPWRLIPPSTEEVANLPNPSQPVIVSILEYLPLKHYFGSQLPQVVFALGILTYSQPKDPERGLRALLQNPRTPRFEDKTFTQRHKRFYVLCHKVHGADVIIPWLNRRQVPIVRETDNYFVYDYAH